MSEQKSPFLRKDYMPNLRRHFHTKSRSPLASKNLYKSALRLTTKYEQIERLAMPSQEHRVDNSHLPQAPAQAPILAPWTYLGPDTALRSEDLSLIRKRNAAEITTYAYTVAPQVIGPANALTRDLEESPLPLLPPPRKEVCQFLLLCLFCLPLLLPLPKSSMRQKTNFRCK